VENSHDSLFIDPFCFVVRVYLHGCSVRYLVRSSGIRSTGSQQAYPCPASSLMAAGLHAYPATARKLAFCLPSVWAGRWRWFTSPRRRILQRQCLCTAAPAHFHRMRRCTWPLHHLPRTHIARSLAYRTPFRVGTATQAGATFADTQSRRVRGYRDHTHGVHHDGRFIGRTAVQGFTCLPLRCLFVRIVVTMVLFCRRGYRAGSIR